MDILAEISRVMELEGRTLTRLRECVGPAYEEAVRLIYVCPGKVIVSGMGKSGLEKVVGMIHLHDLVARGL
jgi:D-arabinose 5-phosphate isomerase GutQ